jgi:hypothetical protein
VTISAMGMPPRMEIGEETEVVVLVMKFRI